MTTANSVLFQRADKLANLHKALERKSIGSELQILKHLLKAMEVATVGLSLPKKGSAPLFLGLSAASIGIYSSESKTGIIGPSLTKVLEALTDGLSTILMPRAGASGKQFLDMLCLSSFSLITCLASQSVAQGIGPLPNTLAEADLKLTRFFGFEFALKLVNSSSILNEAFKIFIESCGGDNAAQNKGAAILTQVAQLLIILAGSQGKGKLTEHLISQDAEYLRKGLNAAAEVLTMSENDGVVNPALAITINQLRIALDSNNEVEFVNTLNDLLENLGTSLEALVIDLQTLHRVASMIIHVSGHSHDEDSFSGIINVV